MKSVQCVKLTFVHGPWAIIPETLFIINLLMSVVDLVFPVGFSPPFCVCLSLLSVSVLLGVASSLLLTTCSSSSYQPSQYIGQPSRLCQIVWTGISSSLTSSCPALTCPHTSIMLCLRPSSHLKLHSILNSTPPMLSINRLNWFCPTFGAFWV